MRCPRCGEETRVGAKFCLECGAPLARGCARCAADLPPEAKFCPECGQSAAAVTTAEPRLQSPSAYTPKHLAERILTSRAALEGARKPVTVLFCDLAGSTPLAQRLGPEAMHALLGRFFELAMREVHRYEGTVNQFLGDGFMALFGAPLTLEDHARRSVLAALAIRRAIETERFEAGRGETVTLSVRMGMNTGPVVVGTIGDNLRMDYTAIGDTTNLAARLQQLAAPGAILVGEATRRLVEGLVHLRAVGPLTVRGKAEPVAAHEVLDLAPRRSPLEVRGERGLSRFAGREREAATLGDLLRQVAEGQGQVVGLVGEPGVGKSRLLYEFRQTVTRAGGGPVTYLEGRCLSYGGAIPYLPILDVLRQHCGISEADPPETVEARVRVALQEVGIDADPATPYLLLLLGIKEGTRGGLATASPEVIKGRTFETLRQLVLQGSRTQTLIFAVEDLHWIDPTSEEWLASLVEHLPGAPLFLVTTYRPGYRPPWMDRSSATQIALRPLSREDSLTVLRSVLDRVPDPLVQGLLGRAEGNPFFLEELAQAVREDAEATALPDVPDTIQGVLLARIDRLPDGPKRLLQVASVLGRHAPRRLIEVLWGGASDLPRHFSELTRLEFLYRESGTEESAYAFKHALTQEVAYQSLLTPQRQALHLAAGRALEALYPADRPYALLAHHYRAAGAHTEALSYHRLAAEAASSAYAVEEALSHYTAALDVATATEASDEPGVLGELHIGRGRVHAKAGDVPRARADFEAALRVARGGADRIREVRALDELGFLLAGAVDYREGTPLIEAALRIAEELQDGSAQASLLSRLSIMYANRLDLDRALDHARRALRLTEDLDDPRSLAAALDSRLLVAVLLGDLAAIDETARRLVEIHRSQGNLWYLQFAVSASWFVEAARGRWDEALTRIAEGLAVNHRVGDHGNRPYFLARESWLHLSRGQYGRALRVARESVVLALGLGHAEWIAWTATALGRALHEVGALEDAARELDLGLRAAERAGSPIQALECAGQLAWTAWCLGETDRARALVGEAEAVTARIRVPPGHAYLVGARACVAVARVHLARGEAERAERMLDPILAAAETSGWAEPIALASLVIGQTRAARGDVPGAEAALRRALEVARDRGLPAPDWEARVALAGLCRGTGRVEEATAHRAEARAIIERLGATLDGDAAHGRYLEAALARLEAPSG